MTKYEAVLMHGDRGGEGTYVFEGPADLLAKSPVKVIKAFMAHLEERHGGKIGHIDYEVNGALKSKEKSIVTGMGDLVLQDGEQPFVVFIAKAR